VVKHAVCIALVRGQEVQKEDTINALITSSASHDHTFVLFSTWHIGLSYAENEDGMSLSQILKK
jgi:hypothetical protein